MDFGRGASKISLEEIKNALNLEGISYCEQMDAQKLNLNSGVVLRFESKDERGGMQERTLGAFWLKFD